MFRRVRVVRDLKSAATKVLPGAADVERKGALRLAEEFHYAKAGLGFAVVPEDLHQNSAGWDCPPRIPAVKHRGALKPRAACAIAGPRAPNKPFRLSSPPPRQKARRKAPPSCGCVQSLCSHASVEVGS